MLASLALRASEKMSVLPKFGISADKITEIRWISNSQAFLQGNWLGLLSTCGRGDLANAIEKKLRQYNWPSFKSGEKYFWVRFSGQTANIYAVSCMN